MVAKHEQHGCTPRETTILDRSEAGESFASIAADLGITEKYVRATVRYYNSGLESDRMGRRAATIASDLHLAAILATGRSYA
jgi:FixJ family two-component response regulator